MPRSPQIGGMDSSVRLKPRRGSIDTLAARHPCGLDPGPVNAVSIETMLRNPNMTFISRTAAAIALGALGAGAQANLVTNGNFETHSINSLGNGTYHCYRNNTFHGWTQSSADSAFGSCFHRGSRDGLPAAFDGNVLMYVNDSGDLNEKVSQTLSLVGGTRYELTFAVNGYSGNSLVAPLEVGFGSFETTIAPRSPSLGWIVHSFIYTPASSGAAELSFKSSNQFESAIFIDSVSVVALPPVVPEPSTYALMALGLGAIGLFARRRRST